VNFTGWILFGIDVALGWEVRLVHLVYTHQTCASCGQVSPKICPVWAIFRCLKCAHAGHADVIAAQNMMSAGLVPPLSEGSFRLR